MEPVLKRAAAGSDNLTWAIGGATLTAQVGLLLGFLSARVLGQYDTGPLLARERAGEPGKVFFLDGNIAAAAGRIGVPVDGLRLWIVLHEMTHALQFEGYPWLRAHLGELLERLISPLADRLGVRETIRRLSENMRTGGRSVELMMNRSQRESFDQMQAITSVFCAMDAIVFSNPFKEPGSSSRFRRESDVLFPEAGHNNVAMGDNAIRAIVEAIEACDATSAIEHAGGRLEDVPVARLAPSVAPDAPVASDR